MKTLNFKKMFPTLRTFQVRRSRIRLARMGPDGLRFLNSTGDPREMVMEAGLGEVALGMELVHEMVMYHTQTWHPFAPSLKEILGQVPRGLRRSSVVEIVGQVESGMEGLDASKVRFYRRQG